jgi:hypothetical protein
MSRGASFSMNTVSGKIPNRVKSECLWPCLRWTGNPTKQRSLYAINLLPIMRCAASLFVACVMSPAPLFVSATVLARDC